jgi:hypothetical protein
VELDATELLALQEAGLEMYYGDDLGATLRDVLFSWWETRYL